VCETGKSRAVLRTTAPSSIAGTLLLGAWSMCKCRLTPELSGRRPRTLRIAQTDTVQETSFEKMDT
jgi:hypothetical protein